MAKEIKLFMVNKQPGFESWPLDISIKYLWLTDFPGVSDGKESSFNAGELGSVPGSERSPGEGYSNPVQHSCLENSIDREAWRANREAWSQK